MPACKNLIGEQYGYLTVIEKTEKRKGGAVVWLCQCQCGNFKETTTGELNAGRVVSCGCKKHEAKFEDLTGQRFGRLIALRPTGKKTSKRCIIWECQCDCGNVTEVPCDSLKKGEKGGTKSCGCITKERMAKLGEQQALDLIGQVYGKLTVLKKLEERNSNGRIMWLCECSCSEHNQIAVSTLDLRRGHTSSCGCLKKSKGEYYIEQLLKENNIFFEKQKTFGSCIFPETNYHLYYDFYVNNHYIIEYDGEQHFTPRPFGGISKEKAEEQFTKIQKRDTFKNQWCKENNIPLIRIPYTHLERITLEDLDITKSKFIVKEEKTYDRMD